MFVLRDYNPKSISLFSPFLEGSVLRPKFLQFYERVFTGCLQRSYLLLNVIFISCIEVIILLTKVVFSLNTSIIVIILNLKV